jgi:hypothetical protein
MKFFWAIALPALVMTACPTGTAATDAGTNEPNDAGLGPQHDSGTDAGPDDAERAHDAGQDGAGDGGNGTQDSPTPARAIPATTGPWTALQRNGSAQRR